MKKMKRCERRGELTMWKNTSTCSCFLRRWTASPATAEYVVELLRERKKEKEEP